MYSCIKYEKAEELVNYAFLCQQNTLYLSGWDSSQEGMQYYSHCLLPLLRFPTEELESHKKHKVGCFSENVHSQHMIIALQGNYMAPVVIVFESLTILNLSSQHPCVAEKYYHSHITQCELKPRGSDPPRCLGC